MKRFEYRTYIYTTNLDDEELTRLSSLGWELVTCILQQNNHFTTWNAIFKREIQ